MPVTAADCQACGACCYLKHHDEGYTPLTAADIRRLPSDLIVTHKRFRLPVLRDKPRHGGVVCVALMGRVGHHVTCSVYADRPVFCREFKPGSRACHVARRDAGIT